eukprot:612204_1
MDNASPFTIAKNKKRPLYHLLSLTESASPRPAKKQKKAKSTSLSHSQSHPKKKKSKSKKAKLPKGDIKTSKMCIKFAKSILFKALSSIKQACTRSPSLEEETSLLQLNVEIICINGPMLSEFDPRPTVNSILAGQYKPRKKCNISKWKQQPYNIGIFAESNDHNNKRRSQYRKSIETVLIPGKDTTQKVKIESVKSVIKQRDRKKAEAHARAKAKAEATKAAA